VLSVEWSDEELGGVLRRGDIVCPDCDAPLKPWGYARPRTLRSNGIEELIRPRRARCLVCSCTHVLLPSRMLLRRRDDVDVIGAAIEARAQGLGYRAIASRCGVPAYTARRWLRRLSQRADGLRKDFATLSGTHASAADAPTPEAATLAGIEDAARALGRTDGDLWAFAALATNGRLLSNTS
jgi:Domain of unknown function (DUF6431)/Homeodomain-like domain